MLRRFNEAAGIPRGRPPIRATTLSEVRCFNEAAGIPRGRRRRVTVQLHQRRASMRPRVFPAEDGSRSSRTWRPATGFNEAAGIPRGRHEADYAPLGQYLSLQ